MGNTETCEPEAATQWCKYVKTVGPSYDCQSLRDGTEKGDFSKFRNCLWNCYSVKEGKKEKEKGSTNYCEAVKTWKVDNPNSCNIVKKGDTLVSKPWPKRVQAKIGETCGESTVIDDDN